MAHRLAWQIAMVRTKLPHQNSLQKMQLAFNAGPPVGAEPPSVAPTVVAALFAAGGAFSAFSLYSKHEADKAAAIELEGEIAAMEETSGPRYGGIYNKQ